MAQDLPNAERRDSYDDFIDGDEGDTLASRLDRMSVVTNRILSLTLMEASGGVNDDSSNDNDLTMTDGQYLDPANEEVLRFLRENSARTPSGSESSLGLLHTHLNGALEHETPFFSIYVDVPLSIPLNDDRSLLGHARTTVQYRIHRRRFCRGRRALRSGLALRFDASHPTPVIDLIPTAEVRPFVYRSLDMWLMTMMDIQAMGALLQMPFWAGPWGITWYTYPVD